MGDCYSRPKLSEIENHRLKDNNKNDLSFISSVIPYQKKLLPSLESSQLQKLIEDLEKEQSVFYDKIENSTSGMPTIPEICLEVKQGLDLYLPGCFNSYKPTIQLSLEPNGPSFMTRSSNKYLPEWFKLIKVKQSLHGFEKVRINVMLEKDKDLYLFLNKLDFNIAELQDQIVRAGWFNMEFLAADDPGMNPRLNLRIQLIHDENALYTVLIKQSNDKIEEISEEISRRNEGL